VWQELYQELEPHGFMVLAVAFDSRDGAAGPWIAEANPGYVTLIDRYHQVAELYNMVNVNQAVWIDEAGRIVRPTESAGAYEGFRMRDRKTLQIPEDVVKVADSVKTTYHNALRDWALKGQASDYAFDAEQARAHLVLPTTEVAEAHAAFSLGQVLIGIGQEEEGNRLVQEASRLHPDSWNFWRQGAGLDERGLAAQADFWERVDALGEKKYYAAVDMKGMPQ
jgi:hypothetical protein